VPDFVNEHQYQHEITYHDAGLYGPAESFCQLRVKHRASFVNTRGCYSGLRYYTATYKNGGCGARKLVRRTFCLRQASSDKIQAASSE